MSPSPLSSIGPGTVARTGGRIALGHSSVKASDCWKGSPYSTVRDARRRGDARRLGAVRSVERRPAVPQPNDACSLCCCRATCQTKRIALP